MAHGRDREKEEERHWIEPLSLRDAPKELRVFFLVSNILCMMFVSAYQ